MALPAKQSMTGTFDFKCFEVVSLEPQLLKRTCEYARKFTFDAIALHNIDYGKYHMLDYTQRWDVPAVDAEAASHSRKWREDIGRGIEIVQEHGLQFWMFHHEIKLPLGFLERHGESFLDFNGDRLWDFVKWKLSEKLTQFPGITGIIFTGTGERMPGYGITVDGALSSGSLVERFSRMYSTIWDICREHGKKLVIRNHGGADDGARLVPRENDFMTSFLRSVEPLRNNVWLMGKAVEPDFQTTYPFNAALVRMARQQPTLLEHSLPMEWNGVNRIPYPMVEDIKSRMILGRELGCIGVMARIDWDISTHQCHYTNSVLGTPNEINAHAFARLANEPGTSVATLLADYARDRYGPAGEEAIAILKDLYLAGNKTHHVLGMRAVGPHNVSGGVWKPYEALANLRGDVLWRRTLSPVDYANLQRALDPDDHFLAEVDSEKADAMAMYGRAQRRLTEARSLFDPISWQQLHDGLERALREAEVHRDYSAAFFRWLSYQESGDQAMADAATARAMSVLQLARRFAADYPMNPLHDESREWSDFGLQAVAAASALAHALGEVNEYWRCCGVSAAERRGVRDGSIEDALTIRSRFFSVTIDSRQGQLHRVSAADGTNYLPDGPVPLGTLEHGGMTYESSRIFRACAYRLHRTASAVWLEMICGAEARRVIVELDLHRPQLKLLYCLGSSRRGSRLRLPILSGVGRVSLAVDPPGGWLSDGGDMSAIYTDHAPGSVHDDD